MSKEELLTRWFVIVNPVAGWGRGLQDFPAISKLLRENGIVSDTVFTEYKHHATELTVEAVNKGYRKIIVVGGDGTLNEVVNGLFIQTQVPTTEILIALVSVGTGNDWARMFGISHHHSAAVRAICDGNHFLQDIGKVTYTESLYHQSRYMVNVAGLGYDAAVISMFNHLRAKGRTGNSLYIKSMIRSYFKYKSSGVKIYLDDKLIYNNLLFSIAIGICKYNGGGIQQLPEAIADDGLLDVTLIKPIHWWNIIFRANKLVNGNIYNIGHVLHERCSKIRIESSPELNIETDGEYLGETPVEIEVVPRAINVVVSRDFYESHSFQKE